MFDYFIYFIIFILTLITLSSSIIFYLQCYKYSIDSGNDRHINTEVYKPTTEAA